MIEDIYPRGKFGALNSEQLQISILGELDYAQFLIQQVDVLPINCEVYESYVGLVQGQTYVGVLDCLPLLWLTYSPTFVARKNMRFLLFPNDLLDVLSYKLLKSIAQFLLLGRKVGFP